MTARLNVGEHSPITADAYDSNRKRLPRGKKAAQWRARCRYRNADGTTSDVTRWAPTKDAAEQAVRAALADKQAGAITGLKLTPGMPFVEAGRYWLTQIQRPERKLSARTQRDYTGAFERYVDAAGSPFRGMTLAEANEVGRIKPALQAIADSKGTQTARLVRVVLGSILSMAVEYRVLEYSGARSFGRVQAVAEKPSEHDHRRAMTRTERDHAIATADAKVASVSNPRSVAKWQTVADLVAFMAATGCRIGEARMLKWSDLDLAASEVHIHGTKSASADRWAPLPPWLAERLARRQKTAKANAKADPLAKPYGPYVFNAAGAAEAIDADGLRVPTGENLPIDQSNLASAVRTVLDEAGLTWAIPHSFRRTVATILHEQNVPLNQVADQLGHSDPSMTAKVYLGRDRGKGARADLAALL